MANLSTRGIFRTLLSLAREADTNKKNVSALTDRVNALEGKAVAPTPDPAPTKEPAPE